MSDTVPQASALTEALAQMEAALPGVEHGSSVVMFPRLEQACRAMRSALLASQAPAAIAEPTQNVEAWLDRNTTFYNTNESTVPVLASVSKRIWYHATDDTESYPFSAVIDAARKAGTP